MTSVFGQLFKYRPRENRLPQEDFFTEALSGVLRKMPDDVRNKFVEWLVGHDNDKVRIKEADIDTQKQVSGGRLDIYIDARSVDEKRHVVAVENKISAEEGANQLERYSEHLGTESDAATRTLVYITRISAPNFEARRNNVTFKPLKWFQVYHWFKESAEAEHAFLCDLLELMEEWNMTIELRLNATDLAAAVSYTKSAEEQLRNVLELVKEKLVIKKFTGKWDRITYFPAYSTPKLGASRIYLFFGFDYDREDDDWSVEKLYIPSAFVAVCGNADKQTFLKKLSDYRTDMPAHMDWDDGLYVRQISKKLLVSKDSFGEAYLDFFNTAIQDFKDVAPKDWFINSS